MLRDEVEKWIVREVSEVKQAPAAVAVLVAIGAVGGWLSARWFDSEQMKLLELQRDTALAGAKLIVSEPVVDPYVRIVVAGSLFAVLATVGLALAVRARRVDRKRISDLTAANKEMSQRHLPGNFPKIEVFQHTKANAAVFDKVRNLFEVAGYVVTPGLTNLPQDAEGVRLKGGTSADRAQAMWGLDTIRVTPKPFEGTDDADQFQVIVGAYEIPPAPNVTTRADAGFSVTAEGARGKAALVIRHSGPKTLYAIEGRIVGTLDGSANPAPHPFHGELQPGAGQKGDFKLALNDGDFALVVVADIGDNRNDWGGGTWLQVRRGKFGSSSRVPDSGVEVEYTIKTDPMITTLQPSLSYLVARAEDDFVTIRPKLESQAKVAERELPIEMRWGGSMKFKAVSDSPTVLEAVRCTLVDARLRHERHGWVTTADTHYGEAFRQKLEVGKGDLHCGQGFFFGSLANEGHRISVQGQPVPREQGGIDHCRMLRAGTWRLAFRLEWQGRSADRYLCFEWAGEGKAPKALEACAQSETQNG